MNQETRDFMLKGFLALLALAAGMFAVIGFTWLLNTQFGVVISSSLRNIAAVVVGLFLFKKIVGRELARQFEIEKK